MSAYLIFNYTVIDEAGYAEYGPAIRPTMANSGAELVVGDHHATPTEGSPGPVTVVMRFGTREAALAWYESPAVQAASQHRLKSTEGIAVLCDGFVPVG